MPHGLIVVAHVRMSMGCVSITATISVNTALYFLENTTMPTGRKTGGERQHSLDVQRPQCKHQDMVQIPWEVAKDSGKQCVISENFEIRYQNA